MAPESTTAVLGGAGFIGSHVVEALASQGETVRVFDRANADLGRLEHLTGWEFVGGDFSNRADLEKALTGTNRVFHLISTTHPASSHANPAYDLETNLIPTVRMLDLAREAGVGRMIFISSGGTVYGVPQTVPIAEDHPTDPVVSYGVAKLAIEKYLNIAHKTSGLEYTILRLSNPFGPRQDLTGAQGAASVFLGRAHAGLPIEVWGDGSVVRDYVYIKDVVEGILAAAGRAPVTGVYNLGSGKGVSLNELLAVIETISDKPVKVTYLPGRPIDVPVNVLDISRARKELGWTPKTSLEQGLRRTWEWLESKAGS